MGSYLFKKKLKIAIIRDNQKLQMKGQTNLWSKKKDRQTCGQRKRTDKLVVKEKGQTNLWSKKKDRQTCGQRKRTDKLVVKEKGQTIIYKT
jgi:hypothetical protein